MVFLRDWEDFEIAAETMYIQSPDKCRFVVKYMHSKGLLQLKLSDNVKVCNILVIAYQACDSVFTNEWFVTLIHCSASNTKRK